MPTETQETVKMGLLDYAISRNPDPSRLVFDKVEGDRFGDYYYFRILGTGFSFWFLDHRRVAAEIDIVGPTIIVYDPEFLDLFRKLAAEYESYSGPSVVVQLIDRTVTVLP